MSSSRPFMDFLRDQRGGVAHDDLSDALQQVVAAVTTEGKAGKLTFTLTVKPAGTKDGALMVLDEIKTALPKETLGGSIFFATPDNNLQREDPKQRKLDLHEINARAAPREIGVPAGTAKGVA